ncbi:A24 family peptidase [Sphingomonas sp. BGYR3]|uniref:prepilin peptidase n=1 Tax=Sphingomonas sp. BGYR3 TaxID=2975483 RepID=UPI0021A6E11B|nr:A24 family peptidase [Sphingomonas sp. BGYR3]MDG5487104.1 A24 family peptidase [Sphingomonas sp. BGYR3]
MPMAEPDWIWPFGLGLLGLVFGSFIATAAIRWPAGRSPMAGRSACDHCAATLGPVELIPLIGFLWLRGRCRRCSGRISRVHPLIEALAMLIGVIAGMEAPGMAGAAGAVFGWILLLLASLDVAAFWLPDWGTGALAMLGLCAGLAGLDPPLIDRAIGGVAGFVALWAVAQTYLRARGRMGLGGGDPKLFGAIGLWLGWEALPLVLLGACIIGLIVVLAMLVSGRNVHSGSRLPFGALLALSAFPIWMIDAIR